MMSLFVVVGVSDTDSLDTVASSGPVVPTPVSDWYGVLVE